MNTKTLGLICLYFLTISNFFAQNNNSEILLPIKDKKGLILKRKNYILSYNKEMNIPNWVAWQLDKDKLIERVSRKNYNFCTDPNLEVVDAIIPQDYAYSGYDRGHMCPAGDSKWSAEAMKESFYMTNICPQHPNLNGGDWHELEQACRRWAKKDVLYIVCGPILYKKAINPPIGKEHKIRVPDAFFKVILAGVEKGKPRAIGFIYKNTAGNHPLDSYVNTIDQVERITGLDFFPALPDEIENIIEKECDLKYWE